MISRKVEWREERENGVFWPQIKVKLSISRSGNYTFEHQGKRYVFKNLLEGTEVLVLEGRNWVKTGRITHYGEIFLGLGESYSEMIERQNKGKSEEQIIAEIKSFLHPVECPSLDRTQKTLDSLKNAKEA
ncbi:MAG: hypothetical protein ABSD42_04485 [Candidatus Bathyarchaeia archaeon]|jgi:hypothetical protein